MANDQPLLVFYDGECPLCRREIGHYRRLRPLVPIEWVDITREPERLQALGIGVNDAMAEFRVIGSDGAAHSGADAFMTLWNALPRYRGLAYLCRLLPVLPALRRWYARFARWHYRRRCPDGVCRSE
jgi:predicted DCC family thiol-disulfide oxidoreductase YuxK